MIRSKISGSNFLPHFNLLHIHKPCMSILMLLYIIECFIAYDELMTCDNQDPSALCQWQDDIPLLIIENGCSPGKFPFYSILLTKHYKKFLLYSLMSKK